MSKPASKSSSSTLLKSLPAPARKEQAEETLGELLQVMTMLRDRQHGCPWDLKQSFRSLLPFTLEEVYEVVEAVESGDLLELEEELGDLLFQVVFYAQLAEEEGHFDFAAVSRGILEKLIRRHPHVFPDGELGRFGQASELSPEQVSENWERIKAAERDNKRRSGSRLKPEDRGVLANVPTAMPALARAEKLQGKAARVGFDWGDIEPVLDKIQEELDELREAVEEGDSAAIEHELGDLLFATVNMARHSKISAETALRRSNDRFTGRFRWIEAKLELDGRKIGETTLSELDTLWEQAKQSGL